jgi:hypothetical protein
MRNITGAIATGADFFGRHREIVQLVRTLLTASVLLTAPRRVGKSSLILRLQALLRSVATDPHADLLRRHGLLVPLCGLCPVAVWFTAEDCCSELDFAQKLAMALQDQGKFTGGVIAQIASLVRKFAKQSGLQKLPVPGLDLPVGAAGDETICSLINGLLRNIENQPNAGTAIIAIDELPEFLIKLERQDRGPQRVAEFLHWLRSLRETFQSRIRWVFLGSIGLDTFVDQRSLTKTLAGLQPMSLGAWEADEANRFLEAIGPAVGLDFNSDVRASILQHAGWAIPYHLQIIVQSLVELKSAGLPGLGGALAEISVTDVSLAVERLLLPDGYMRFDTWRQRLKDQLSAPDHAAALRILRVLCSLPMGLQREQLLHELLRGNPVSDVEIVSERLAQLLALLQRDGYLLQQNNHYAFRSFLLREYWYRREVR